MPRLLAPLIFLLTLVSCAGYRSGILSMPYVGDTPPPETKSASRGAIDPIRVPGATLGVELNNTMQQNDYRVMLFVVPMSIDPRDQVLGDKVGGLKLYLSVAPEAQSFVFRPEHVRIEVDGVRYSPALASLRLVHDPGVKETQWMEPDPGRDPRGLRYALDKPQRTYYFRLLFDAPIPKPDRNISLDISEALVSPDQARIPLIRYRQVRWSEGYT